LTQTCEIRLDQPPVRQFDRDLVALSDIAHEGSAPFAHRRTGSAGLHQGTRLRRHLLQQIGHRGGIESIEPDMTAAHQLVRDGRRKKSDCRADAGVRRHDHARDADLLGNARRMQRCGAAESDHGVLTGHGAALDRMHAGCARHVLAHDLMHGVGRGFRRQSQRLADIAQQCLF
jgi:hypothetical protein